jgi:hypothetical protein
MKKIQINPQIIYIKSKTSTDYNYKKVKGLWSFELNKTDLDMLVNYSTLYFTDDTIYAFMAIYIQLEKLMTLYTIQPTFTVYIQSR